MSAAPDRAAELLELAERTVTRGKQLGAEEVAVSVSGSSHVTIQRRGGKVEQATEATTKGLSLSVLVDDRYSSHSTSDLRPDALDDFLKRAIEATRYLEPDPDRRLPDVALCGRGVSNEQLDQDDPAWYTRTADDRAALALELEQHLQSHHDDAVISSSTYTADGQSESCQVFSNGFADANRGAWFAVGGDMTLEDPNGKRPESYAYYGARYLSDLPSPADIAAEINRRTRERLGSEPIESGIYPMVLANRAAGRLLGVLGGPLAGGSLHDHRSCLADRLGTKIGSEHFTLLDDPAIPRGLGSRPYDDDGLIAKPRTIVEAGELREYNISVYYGRKLGMDPTSGSRSNWVIPPGTTPTDELLAQLPKAILVTSFLGGNSNAATGDFSFGIRGTLLEHGKPVKSLSEMNVAGNVTTIFERLAAVGDDPWKWSSMVLPTLILEDVRFSGT